MQCKHFKEHRQKDIKSLIWNKAKEKWDTDKKEQEKAQKWAEVIPSVLVLTLNVDESNCFGKIQLYIEKIHGLCHF